MKKTLLSLFGLCIAGAASAQIYITDIRFDPNGVNNDGLVVGSQDQNQPILLWDAKKGGDESAFTNIGGISAGQGIGGVARFSGDGKFVTAPMPYDAIPLATGWKKSEYADFNYKYTDVLCVAEMLAIAAGTSEDGKSGIILTSSNNGVTWKRADLIVEQAEDGSWLNYTPDAGILSLTALSDWQLLAGTNDGRVYTSGGNGQWSPVEILLDGGTPEVKAYPAMDFLYSRDVWGITSETALYGVLGVELADGGYAVWYTEDSGDTWKAATGVSGLPKKITHVGETFFMITANGHIQKSEDKGKTWTDCFSTTSEEPLNSISFADEQKGVATSLNVIYLTRDGGTTWKQTAVLPTGIWTKVQAVDGNSDESVTWYDATWSNDTIFVAGTGGNVYCSVDDGEAFSKQEVDDGYTGDYTVLSRVNTAYNLFGTEGNIYNMSTIATASGYCGGIYDIENETWTPLASSGYMSGYSGCCPWQFSGDGKTVVGTGYFMSALTNSVNAHAAAMSPENIIDLGSKFENINRASSALGVSYDASVIVGWQDIFGPRFGAVWTRNEDGSYTQRMMLKDTSKDEDDINYDDKQDCYDNLVATARSVSPDGKWIGGDGSVGDSAFPGPWLWNEEEGYKLIFDDAEVDGGVAAVSNNGEKAIGWQGLGSSAWLYTKDGGVQYLQDYVTNVLGCDLGDFFICSVYDMSPNGRYVTGYGMRGDQVLGYMIDLEGKGTSIEDKVVSQTKASVYPNPVSDELHVDLPYGAEDVKTTLTLVDMQGCAVRRVETVQTSNIINVSNLPQGIYILDVNARGSHKAFKVVIKH